jgi:hypothetical protein
MKTWLHWLGLGQPCHRCGAKVPHRPDLFRIDGKQCCAECYAFLSDIADRRAMEEGARDKIRYGRRTGWYGP